MEVMRYNDGAILVRLMERDGHCLFSAIVSQLYGTNGQSEEHYNLMWDLRRTVVTHIRQHQERFREILETQIMDPEIIVPGDSLEEKIGFFLSRLETTNEWGGTETIIAVTEISGKRLDLFNEQGPLIKFNESGTTNGTIRIAYRLTARTRNYANRNHYDSVVQVLQTNRREQTVNQTDVNQREYGVPNEQIRAWHRNPRIMASQISNRSENTGNIEGIEITEKKQLKFASWNVRGCASEIKRNKIDEVLVQQGILIAAIQESRLPGCTIETENFYWYNVNDDNTTRPREGGGTAIVVAKAIHVDNKFKKISANSCSYLSNHLGESVMFIATYVRPVQSADNGEFGILTRYVSGLPNSLQNRIVTYIFILLLFLSVNHYNCYQYWLIIIIIIFYVYHTNRLN